MTDKAASRTFRRVEKSFLTATSIRTTIRDMAELVLLMKGREVSRVPITKTRTVIGRSPDAEVHIDNAGVSRHHALIESHGDDFVLVDTGSENGVFVNGRPVDRFRLNHGDRVQIGKFEVCFSVKGGVAPSRLQRVDSESTREVRFDDKTYSLSADEVAQVLQRAKLGGAPPKPKASRHSLSASKTAEARSSWPIIFALVVVFAGIAAAVAYVYYGG